MQLVCVYSLSRLYQSQFIDIQIVLAVLLVFLLVCESKQMLF